MSVKTERSTFSHFLFPDVIGMGATSQPPTDLGVGADIDSPCLIFFFYPVTFKTRRSRDVWHFLPPHSSIGVTMHSQLSQAYTLQADWAGIH